MARKNSRDRGIVERPANSGKWYVRITLNGRDRLFRVGTKTEGKALYGRLKAEALAGKYFEKPKTIPFREIAQEYLDRVNSRRGKTNEDKARMDRWKTAFGNQDAKTITTRQIEREIHKLAEEGKKPGTVIRYLTVLKATLNNAKRLGLVQDDPASNVKLPNPNNVLIRYLTTEQETTLMKWVPPKYQPIVQMALNTGCRQGELLRLCWGDVDWNIGVLTIWETKAGDVRRVPLNSAAQRLLVELKDQGNPNTTDRIFLLDRRYLRRVFDKAVEEAGLAPFRFHDLRHTFASRLAMQGANDRTLMALGGWKSPAMLARYAHLSPTYLWQAVEGLTRYQGQFQNGNVTKNVTSEEEREAGTSQPVEKHGEPRATRTLGPRLKRAMLYQLS